MKSKITKSDVRQDKTLTIKLKPLCTSPGDRLEPFLILPNLDKNKQRLYITILVKVFEGSVCFIHDLSRTLMMIFTRFLLRIEG
jgi:hypothetical protein